MPEYAGQCGHGRRATAAFTWTRGASASALGALVVALSAQVVVPVPFSPVPMTLQPLAVLVVGGLLGAASGARRTGALSRCWACRASGVFRRRRRAAWHCWARPADICSRFLAAASPALWPAALRHRTVTAGRCFGSSLACASAWSIIHLGGVAQLALLGGDPALAFRVGFVPFLTGDLLKVGLAAAVILAVEAPQAPPRCLTSAEPASRRTPPLQGDRMVGRLHVTGHRQLAGLITLWVQRCRLRRRGRWTSLVRAAGAGCRSLSPASASSSGSSSPTGSSGSGLLRLDRRDLRWPATGASAWHGLAFGLGVGGGSLAMAAARRVVVPRSRLVAATTAVCGDYLARSARHSLVLAPAALSEEVMFRGLPLVSWLAPSGRGTRSCWSRAGVRADPRALNPGVTPLGLGNIALAGIFLGVAFYAPGGIWTAFGAHSGWNATLAALDAPVSGLPFDIPLARLSAPASPAWLTGAVRPGRRAAGHRLPSPSPLLVTTQLGRKGPDVKRAAVIGAGTMGNGIAHVFAQHGWDVALIDTAPAALEKATATIRANLDRQVKKGTLPAEAAGQVLGRITTGTALDAAARPRSWSRRRARIRRSSSRCSSSWTRSAVPAPSWPPTPARSRSPRSPPAPAGRSRSSACTS